VNVLQNGPVHTVKYRFVIHHVKMVVDVQNQADVNVLAALEACGMVLVAKLLYASQPV